MKTISCWRDLEQFGIDALTGEADALSFRLLCDLTAKGQKIVEKTIGCKLVLAEEWNGGTTEEPHVGSMMLAPEFLLPIGIFALLESGCTEVLVFDGALLGIESTDDEDTIEGYRSMQKTTRVFRYKTEGDRNRHQMSQRLV